MRRNQTREPIQPIEIIRDVPRDLNELCMKLLCRDPAGRPAGREVLRALGAPTAEALSGSFLASTREPQFIGRARQLVQLHEAFATAREGLTMAVYIHGNSGMGKSTLVRMF